MAVFHFHSLPCECVRSVLPNPRVACYICVKYYCEQRMVIICLCYFLESFWCSCSRSSSFPTKASVYRLPPVSDTSTLCIDQSVSIFISFACNKQFINAFVLLHIYSNFPFRFPAQPQKKVNWSKYEVKILGMMWTLQTEAYRTYNFTKNCHQHCHHHHRHSTKFRMINLLYHCNFFWLGYFVIPSIDYSQRGALLSYFHSAWILFWLVVRLTESFL